MTRKEEIRQQSVFHSLPWDDAEEQSKCEDIFVKGAEWADKTMIEKAVEWLQKYFVEDHYGMSPSGFCVFADMFIKAMEE